MRALFCLPQVVRRPNPERREGQKGKGCKCTDKVIGEQVSERLDINSHFFFFNRFAC